MSQLATPIPDLGGRPVRLDTLVRLRWLAVGGQTASLLFVTLVLGFPVPLLECLVLIGLSILLNLGLLLRFGAGHRSSVDLALAQLVFDTLQLGGLLWLTGGLLNPFSILLLAPVSVSATTLPPSRTLSLGVVASVIVSILGLTHLPLPWRVDQPLLFDRLYVIGIWVALLCGITFIAAYTNRVAHEARMLLDALAATELALSRQQQLRALDGLAAAAAHELGTPLSTIALAAREMKDDVPPGPLAEDVDLILEQAMRCRKILAKLRSLNEESGEPFAVLGVRELVAEAAQPHQQHGKAINLTWKPNPDEPEPSFPRHVGLLYGLGNLIENAANFAESAVEVHASWDRRQVSVTITDDGPGFPPDLVARLGEPYLTSRPHRNGERSGGGLGLGIFIAKTLLERTGAVVRFSNQLPEGHARVTVSWQRDAIALEGAGSDPR